MPADAVKDEEGRKQKAQKAPAYLAWGLQRRRFYLRLMGWR